MSLLKDRRQVCTILGTASTFPLALLPQNGVAAVPFLLRLFLGGAFRRTATRAVAGAGARAAVGTAARTATTSTFQAVATLGITGTGVVAVSAGVWALANESKAKQIWVAGTDVVNRFLLASDKATTEHERLFVGYRVVNATTGQVEASHSRLGFSSPGSKPLEFPFEVKPLPNPGLMRVEPFVSMDESGLEPHPRFAVSGPELVVVASADQVTLAG